MKSVRVAIPKNARRGEFLIFGMKPTAAYYLGREIGEKMENLYPIPSLRDRPGKDDRVIGTIDADERRMPNEVAEEVLSLMENYDSIRDSFRVIMG
jgi:hypothetical protein